MADPKLNGSGKRALASWIDRFVEATSHVETPAIFRKWAGITTIAAALEQKVWIMTSSPMYPNLYTGMIAQPGVGKTRIIAESAKLLLKLPEPVIAPTSINSSSLVDHLVECKRTIINLPNAPLEYNSMVILADELGTFMSEYDDGLVAELTSFYDVTALPYGQRRRGHSLNGGQKLKIERPQLNMLFGSTPSNLLRFMPEGAWSQGFASRIIFIFSDERNMVDDFAREGGAEVPEELIHDLKIINNLMGKFSVTEEYRIAVNLWRKMTEEKQLPQPTHPRLQHYCSRRKAHIYRLSMISSIDRDNSLVLTKDDFLRAKSWLEEAEEEMPRIFSADNLAGSDGAVIDEAVHMIQSAGKVTEGKLVTFIRQRVPAHAVLRVIEIIEKSGSVKATKDRFGVRAFHAISHGELQ